MLATSDFLSQDRLDDLELEEALIPPLRSHQQVVVMPEVLLDELSWMLPDEEASVVRPQRKACHRLRKLVRTLNGRERKIIRSLYFREMAIFDVAQKMRLSEHEA